jgi:hypothetical protein
MCWSGQGERGMRLGIADFRRYTVRAFRTVPFAVAFTERTATSRALDLAEQKILRPFYFRWNSRIVDVFIAHIFTSPIVVLST